MTKIRVLSFVFFIISHTAFTQGTCVVNSNSDVNEGIVNGSSAAGDLRFCLSQASASGDGYLITFDNTLTGAIALNGTLPAITTLLTISGSSNGIVLNGGGVYSILSITTGTVTASNLTFSNGYTVDNGAAINNNGVLYLSLCTINGCNAERLGGGIYNSGALLYVNNCTIGNNVASGSGGGIEQEGTGLLHVTHSCLYNNVAGKYSGAIDVLAGSLMLDNSTLYGNSAGQSTFDQQSSGAMWNGGVTTIVNCTIVNNSATGDNFGGGIYNFNNLLLINSILTGNTANVQGLDLFNDPAAVLNAYNNIFTSDVSGLSDGLNGNMINATLGGVLFSNGLVYKKGATPIVPLAYGSPAIGTGVNTFSGLVFDASDQSGLSRVDIFDVGASEFQPIAQYITGLPIIGNRSYGNPVITITGVKGGDSGNPLGLTIQTDPAGNVASIIGYLTSISGITTFTGCLISISGIGSVTVTGTQAGNLYYAPATTTHTFSINKGSQYFSTISSVPGSVMYGKTLSVNMSATASTGLDVTFSIITYPAEGVASLSGNVISILGTGNVTVTTSQIGNDYYDPAPDFVQYFSVAQGTQTVTGFSIIPNVTFGGAGTITIFANTSSNLPASFSLITDPSAGVASIVNNIISILGAGNVTVTASQVGNSNYLPARDFYRIFTIAKENQQISFDHVSDITYGITSSILLPKKASSGLLLNYLIQSDPASGVVLISNYVMSIVGPGSVTLVVSQPGDVNYFPAENVSSTFTVLPGTTPALSPLQEQKSLAVFPNPNNGNFVILFYSATGDIPEKISILNNLGTEVKKLFPGTNKERFELSGLAPGLYFVKAGVIVHKIWVE